MRSASLAVGAAAILSLSTAAARADEFYVAGFTGVALAGEADADVTVFAAETKGDQSFDPGFVVGGAAGYKFRLRAAPRR